MNQELKKLIKIYMMDYHCGIVDKELAKQRQNIRDHLAKEKSKGLINGDFIVNYIMAGYVGFPALNERLMKIMIDFTDSEVWTENLFHKIYKNIELNNIKFKRPSIPLDSDYIMDVITELLLKTKVDLTAEFVFYITSSSWLSQYSRSIVNLQNNHNHFATIILNKITKEK